IALDVGMLVTGTIEIRGAMAAATAGEMALRTAAAQALKGTFRASIGLTGLFNNAAVKETEFGRNFLMGRNMVMLTDATFSLGKSGLAWLKGANGLESATSTAAIMDKTVKNL